MPAKVVRQDREIKALFRQRIREKLAREREELQDRIDAEVPSWISWALKPVAGLMLDAMRSRDAVKGQAGEDRSALSLWLWLPRGWIVINDLVLEPRPGDFMQVDHVLVGPGGVYLVETKNWDGAFSAYRDKWRRKQGNSWVHCESPTKQNLRHVRLFKTWSEDNLPGQLPSPSDRWLFPVVLFIRAKWLKVAECSMPVLQSGLELATYVRRRSRDALLSPDQVESLAQALVQAKPYDRPESEATAWDTPTDPFEAPIAKSSPREGVEAATGVAGPTVQTGHGRDGREWVKVTGSKEEAEEVRAGYATEGRSPSPLKGDRFTKGAWFFYLYKGKES